MMYKNIFPFFLVLLVILGWFGFRNMSRIADQNTQLQLWQQDSIKSIQLHKERSVLAAEVTPKDDWIQPLDNVPPPPADFGPYLSAAQGVEVHLEGLRWNNTWFKRADGNRHGIQNLGGVSDIQINQIIFDPDFPKAGMPDLNIEVTAPRFFKMKNFLNSWVQGFHPGSFMDKLFDTHRAIETFDLETAPGKKTKMSHWLIEFDTFLRIEPSPDHTSTNIGGLKHHPITKQSTRSIRFDRESKNQRYGNVSVMLKFKPKNSSWYIADTDENSLLVPNKSPKIGIAAVECVGIKRVSENKKLNNIGVYLRKGSSLALYDSPAAIDATFGDQKIQLDEVITAPQTLNEPYEALAKGKVYNESFVDRDKYAIIHLANLGSWQEGSWLSSRSRYADQFHAKFVIHAYVFGEWQVKPVHLVDPEPRPPFELQKSGLLDFLLPDFNLGAFGKLLSGFGWGVLLLIVLSIFFPPIGKLINVLLSWVVALVPKPKKKE